MELSRQEYPAILVRLAFAELGGASKLLDLLMGEFQENLQPAQAVDALNERVKHVGRLNIEVADWLKVSYDTGMVRRIWLIQNRNAAEWKKPTQTAYGDYQD